VKKQVTGNTTSSHNGRDEDERADEENPKSTSNASLTTTGRDEVHTHTHTHTDRRRGAAEAPSILRLPFHHADVAVVFRLPIGDAKLMSINTPQYFCYTVEIER
jgi:hypothetical protein